MQFVVMFYRHVARPGMHDASSASNFLEKLHSSQCFCLFGSIRPSILAKMGSIRFTPVMFMFLPFLAYVDAQLAFSTYDIPDTQAGGSISIAYSGTTYPVSLEGAGIRRHVPQ